MTICNKENEINLKNAPIHHKIGELKISKLNDNPAEKDALNLQPYPERSVLYKLRKTQSIQYKLVADNIYFIRAGFNLI